MTEKPTVLFACVHNAGRSLAAKVLLEHYAQGHVTVLSAGSEPGAILNPAVVEVLHERGLSTQNEIPTLLSFATVEEADIVVTMGCGETCPVLPGRSYRDWNLSDPAGQPLDQVRIIVDEIDQRVQALLAELANGPE